MKFLLLLSALLPALASAGSIPSYPLGNAATSGSGSVTIYNDSATNTTKKLLLSDFANIPALSTPAFCTAKPITGFAASAGTVTATDTVLQAFNKIVGNINAISAASTTVGTFDSQTPAANGQTIAANTLYGQSASATVPGMVNIAAQTFAGVKTFAAGIIANVTGNLIGDVTGTASGNEVPLTFGDGLTRTVNDIDCDTASGSVFGCLSSTDWNTFNGKQASGNYITALTGDGTASGPGSAALTLATVNGNVGSFTYGSFTVNAKGLITAASSGAAPVSSITVASANGFTGSSSGGATPALTIATSITGLLKGNGTAISAAAAGTDYQVPITSGDGTTSGGAFTLANAGAGAGSCTSCDLTIDAKGRVTAYADGSGGGGGGSGTLEDWATCLMVPRGYGTVTNNSAKCRREGDSLAVRGSFNAGNHDNGLPIAVQVYGSGALTVDPNKVSVVATTAAEGEMVGTMATSPANQNVYLLSNVSTSKDYIYSGRTFNVASHMIPAVGAEFTNGSAIRYNALIPIYGWTNTAASTATATSSCTGGSLTSNGDYDICTYDTPGSYTFSFSAANAGATYDVEVIGGGGSGGANTSGGGGGAGGFCRGMNLTAGVFSKSVTVGAGGAGVVASVGNDGGDSVFDTTTAKGGGKGGYAIGTGQAIGSDGGAGGGGASDGATRSGGSTTQAATSGSMICFGYNGGTSYGASPYNAGGGGGSLEAGETPSTPGGGKGGEGRVSVITGLQYAAGGGGGAGSSGGNQGLGGQGGGGNGGNPTRGCPGGAGITYGSGGGGEGRSCSGTAISGSGYKGAVLIKWKAR